MNNWQVCTCESVPQLVPEPEGPLDKCPDCVPLGDAASMVIDGHLNRIRELEAENANLRRLDTERATELMAVKRENALLREVESFMRERAAMLVEDYDGHGHELMPLKELAAAIRSLRAALEGRGDE